MTVLFCDLDDFISLMTLGPTDLVQLLDRVYMLFDHISERHGVLKIETVGKTYMACAMSSPDTSNSETHAADATAAVLMGIDMLELVKHRVLGVGGVSKVFVKIGLHTGRALSGVVGSLKPQYALFGDTVNVAARMTTTGLRNHVHVSSETFSRVQDSRFHWEPRQTPVKGYEEPLETYLLAHYNLGHKEAMDGPVLEAEDSDDEQASPKQRRSSFFAAPVKLRQQASRLFDAQVPSWLSEDHLTLAPSHGSDGMSFMSFISRDSVKTAMTKITDSVADRFFEGDVASDLGKQVGLLLAFHSERVEHEFRAHKDGGAGLFRASSLAFVFCYGATSLCVVLGRQGQASSDLLSVCGVRFGYWLVACVLFFVIHKGHGEKRGTGDTSGTRGTVLSNATAFLVITGFVGSLMSNVVSLSGGFKYSYAVEAFFFITMLPHACGVFARCLVFIVACVLLTTVIAVLTCEDAALLEVIVCLLVLPTLQLYAIYHFEWCERGTFTRILASQEENRNITQLLNHMLPQEMLFEMKLGRLSLAYLYMDMTILFSDIVDFTKYCSEHTPEEAVSLVSLLFHQFDEFTARLGVYKVCTIGDAYVVVNEPKKRTTNRHANCLKIVTMAKWMLQIILTVREQVGHDKLDMRIGIHHGAFVAGVIGTKRLRFDVWGPDVLFGNKVESNGLAGHIVVSEPCKRLLEGALCPKSFAFTFHKALEYNLDEVSTYLCTRPDGERFPAKVDPAENESDADVVGGCHENENDWSDESDSSEASLS